MSGSPSLSEYVVGTSVGLVWTGVQGATGYDVIAGDLQQLHVSGGDFAASTIGCVVSDSPYLAVVASGAVPPGGAWYLVRAVNTCSGNGSYDDGTQQGSRDAEIGSSVHACP